MSIVLFQHHGQALWEAGKRQRRIQNHAEALPNNARYFMAVDCFRKYLLVLLYVH